MGSIDHACLGRRCVLTTMAAGAAAALTGCTVYGDESAPATTPATATSAAPSAATSASTQAGGPDGTATTAAANAIAQVADIPVGGGLVLAAQGIVLTRPSADDVKAFSATCTHAGCQVTEVRDATINCPCHGSRFAVADGAPTAGPATRPLAPVAISVAGGAVVLA